MTTSIAPFTFSCATVDITPTKVVPLAGYSRRREPYRDVSSKLEGNAILLGDSRRRVLFVSADLLFFGRDLVSTIVQRAEQLGMARDDVVLTASHTHFAPATDRTKPLLGDVDAEYARFIEDRLLRLVSNCMSSPPANAHLEFSRVEGELNVARRRRWLLPTATRKGLVLPPSIVMAPAVDGERDASVDAIRVVDDHGRVGALFWKFACHPVCFPDADRVSAEYPGHARTEVRRSIGAEIPVVFWQGFGGDVRPRIDISPSLADRLLALGRGPGFSPATHERWSEWVNRVGRTLVAVVRAPAGRQLHGPLTANAVDVPVTMLIDARTNPLWRDHSMRIQQVSFGSVKVLFVAAEVCSPYVRLLRSQDETIFVGYSGDVFGYLPSARQAAEGGYEGREFFKAFGLQGRMLEGFEDVVRTAVDTISRAARV